MARKNNVEAAPEVAQETAHEADLPNTSAAMREMGLMEPNAQTGNGTAAAPKRKRTVKRVASERTYWVVGRAHIGGAVQRIMPAPTIGRGRKAVDTVRSMPAYTGWELWVERCVRVT